MLHVLNMPMDASLACWALFFIALFKFQVPNHFPLIPRWVGLWVGRWVNRLVGQWTRQSVDRSLNWSVGGLVVWVDRRMEGWYFVEFFPPIAYIRMYVVFVGIFFSFFVLLL